MESMQQQLSAIKQFLYYHLGFKDFELCRLSSRISMHPLYNAVKENNMDFLKDQIYLKKYQVNEIISINNESTMIHEAVVIDRPQVFEFLVSQGADINFRDRNGMTPLLKAAALGRLYFVKRLVELGANPYAIDPWGNNALDKAFQYEEWEVIDFLKSK